MKKWLRSARYALSGIVLALREERNMRIQCIAALMAVVLSIILKVSLTELSIVLIASALVICIESLNSAVERLCDMVKPRIALQLQAIKDLLSGAVLLASCAALGVGILMFVPKIVSLIVQ
ncbi:MAG: diacylglycerol kinase family protein [Patescibacteria group bacterium]